MCLNKNITIGYMKLEKGELISNITVTNNFLDIISKFVKVKIIPIKERKSAERKLETIKIDYLLTDIKDFGIDQFIWREKQKINIPFIIILHTIYHWIEALLYIIPMIREEDIIISPSQYTRDSFYKISEKLKVHIIPHCIDVCKIYKSSFEYSKNKIKEITYMGRIVREKNIKALIDCMPKVISRLGKVHLNIIGPLSGETTKDYPKSSFIIALERKIKKLKLTGNINFTGLRLGQDKYKILSKSDVFVYPTVYVGENFAMSNLEALACGIPVVTTDWAGNKEFIREGENGYLVDISYTKNNILKINKKQLASLIIKVLQDEQRLSFMKRKAYKSALNYDFRKVIPKLIKLLRKKRFSRSNSQWRLFRSKNIIQFKGFYKKEMLFFVYFFGMGYKTYADLYNRPEKYTENNSRATNTSNKNNKDDGNKIIQAVRNELFRYLCLR